MAHPRVPEQPQQRQRGQAGDEGDECDGCESACHPVAAPRRPAHKKGVRGEDAQADDVGATSGGGCIERRPAVQARGALRGGVSHIDIFPSPTIGNIDLFVHLR